MSEATVGLLEQLDYLPRAYYANDRITPVLMLANIVLHLALFTALFALVFAQKGEKEG